MPNVSELFYGLKQEEVDLFLNHSGYVVKTFQKNEAVFLQGKVPNYLFILQSGSVVVENVDQNGKRYIINEFNEVGTVFGEVYLYIRNTYDYSAYAMGDTKIMMIPRESMFFGQDISDEKNCNQRQGASQREAVMRKIINNMLVVLSNKAFYLNQKLLISNSTSIREKLCKYILTNGKDGVLKLNFNREELSSFLSIPRPSLSRELMNMQKDGLIAINRNVISYDEDALI